MVIRFIKDHYLSLNPDTDNTFEQVLTLPILIASAWMYRPMGKEMPTLVLIIDGIGAVCIAPILPPVLGPPLYVYELYKKHGAKLMPKKHTRQELRRLVGTLAYMPLLAASSHPFVVKVLSNTKKVHPENPKRLATKMLIVWAPFFSKPVQDALENFHRWQRINQTRTRREQLEEYAVYGARLMWGAFQIGSSNIRTAKQTFFYHTRRRYTGGSS